MPAAPGVEAVAAGLLERATPEDASLSKRTLDAFAWRLLSESSRLVLQIGIQIALARLLPVEAFGLLAVAMMVVAFGARVSEIGAAPALIQRSTITATHIRVAFSLSIVCGALVSGVIWSSAPAIASVFKAPPVTPVLRLIGLTFVFGSFGTTAEALMQRRMDYRRLLRVDLVSYALGYAAVGVGLAALQYGVWALAWATVAQSIVKSALLIMMSPHPAQPSFARAETRQLLNFGIGITLSRLASFAAQNGDYFVVARWLGTAALGLYSRAYQLMCMPIYQFSSILNVVLFPAYSSIQNDRERLQRGYLGSLCLSAIVVFPVLTTMAVVSPELMTGLFGRQWASAAVPLQILCLAGACYCIYNLADSLVRAQGAVYAKFVCHSIYALCVLGGAYGGTRWHITGVAIGVVVANMVVYLLMAHLSLRLTGASWRAFLRAQQPAAVVSTAAAIVGVSVVTISRAAGLPPLVILAVSSGACGIVAATAVFVMPARWLSPDVHALIGSAKKYARNAAAGLFRRRQPQTT